MTCLLQALATDLALCTLDYFSDICLQQEEAPYINKWKELCVVIFPRTPELKANNFIWPYRNVSRHADVKTIFTSICWVVLVIASRHEQSIKHVSLGIPPDCHSSSLIDRWSSSYLVRSLALGSSNTNLPPFLCHCGGSSGFSHSLRWNPLSPSSQKIGPVRLALLLSNVYELTFISLLTVIDFIPPLTCLRLGRRLESGS